MLIKIKEKLALAVEIAKASYELNSDPFYMVFNKTVIAGIEVFIDDKVVLASTGTKIIPNAVVTNSGVIVINNALLTLDKAQQAAIILHEYGHKSLNHKAIPVLYQVQLLLACGNSLQMEYEADLYAVAHKADMLALLQYWWDTYPETRMRALRKRIQNLENYYEKFQPKFEY